ncbi:septal ring lytic transglycosylase RlpA family protein [Rodentibacter caecimuris]
MPLFAESNKQYDIKGAKLSHRPMSGTQSSYTVKGVTYTSHSHQSAKYYNKEGIASYYHQKFNGRRTANGEIYRSSLYTAAHKTLPLNSYALVTNLRNNRKVIVRINDRGPFSQKRIIDLSYAAAKEIGLIQRGIGKVKVEALQVSRNGKISGSGTKTLAKTAQNQAAADRLIIEQGRQNSDNREIYKIKMLNFSSKQQAQQIIRHFSAQSKNIEIVKNGSKYDIYWGPFNNKSSVNNLKSQLQKLGQHHPLIIYTYK